MAHKSGLHHELVLIDQSELRQRQRELHASHEQSLTRFPLELLNGLPQIPAHELRVPIDPVQGARHDVLLCRVDRPGEGFHPIRPRSRPRRRPKRCLHHFVSHPAKEEGICLLEVLDRVTMQVFVRERFTMIAAPVQCDVDGIPKGSHYARVPLKSWMRTGICRSRIWIWKRADFLGLQAPCTGDLPAGRQASRRHFVAPVSSRLPSCLSRKPPPRWGRYKMTGLCRPWRLGPSGRSAFPCPFILCASLASCVLFAENGWPELACRELLHGEQACAEVLGRQAPLAEKLAQKIRGREVALAGVAAEAAGNEVAERIASGLGERHHVVQAMRPAGSPAQAVEAHAMLACVDGPAQSRCSHEIKLVQIDLAL